VASWHSQELPNPDRDPDRDPDPNPNPNPNPNQVGAAYSSSYTKDPIAEALGVIRLGVGVRGRGSR
jgi:hypothetical protein